MKKINFYLTIVGILTFSGCSSAPKHFDMDRTKYNPALSRAMNLALLTELTSKNGPLKDSASIKYEEVSNIRAYADSTANAVELASVVSGIADGILNPTTAIISSITGLGKALQHTKRRPHPIFFDHFFAWMPADLAKNADDASVLMSDLLHKAMEKSLPSKAKVIKNTKTHISNGFGRTKLSAIIFTVGDERFTMFSESQIPQEIGDYRGWLFSGKRYYWSYQSVSGDLTPVIGVTVCKWVSKTKCTISNDQSVTIFSLLPKFSQNLPNWVYIYDPPNIKLKKAPYFLNKGNVLPFVSRSK